MTVVPTEPVRPDRSVDRRILLVTVVVLFTVGGFIVGRIEAPSPASSPRPSAGISSLGPLATSAALSSPVVQPAVIPPDMESAAAAILAQGSWALCETSGGLRCEPLASMELTASEAAQASTAWPRLTPVVASAGEVVIAAPSSSLDYALFVSLDPSTRPTLLDPAVTVHGVAFLDLGPDLPEGHYVVMVARVPGQGSYDKFDAAGLIVGR
jgi:hypothetical protein